MRVTYPRFKVSRTKLIEEVKAGRDQAIAQYEEQLKEYPKKLAEWKKQALARLEAAKTNVKDLVPIKDTSSDWRSWTLELGGPPAEPPLVDTVTCRFDDRLRYLESIDGDTLMMSQPQYEGYTEKVKCG